MSISRQQHMSVAYHGLYLVPESPTKSNARYVRSNFYYRIAAVGAALFLAMTVC